MHKCKITVVKREFNQDLAEEYLNLEDMEGVGPCDRFSDGQEFVIDQAYTMPEDFCTWAWADIRRDILMMATGSELSWMRQPNTRLAGCTDWFRPVIFKIERIEE